MNMNFETPSYKGEMVMAFILFWWFLIPAMIVVYVVFAFKYAWQKFVKHEKTYWGRE